MKKRKGFARLVFPGVLGLALHFGWAGGEYSYLDARRAEADLEARRAEIGDVRRQIDSIRTVVSDLRNDDEALERYARERYGFIRDGEYLYFVSDLEAPESPSEAEEPDRRSLLRWLRRNEG